MNNDTIVIKLEANELSIRRAEKEAEKARLKGQKVAFDLTGIKDTVTIRELIKHFSGIAD